MHSLLLATWLMLPIAPLNPLEQDTLPSSSMHFSIGVSSPSNVLTFGPEVSAKYELLVHHPIVARASVDYRYGELQSQFHPRGVLHTTMFSVEGLYYRGTDNLTGYLGAGLVFAGNWFSPSANASDSLLRTERVVDVDVGHQIGYRLTFGLRLQQQYSLEIGITELRPDVIKFNDEGENLISKEYREIETGGFRVTFGYILPIGSF